MSLATIPDKPLRVATLNIHKGMSIFNRRVVIHALRDQLRALDADIVFLQEVVGPPRHPRAAPWQLATRTADGVSCRSGLAGSCVRRQRGVRRRRARQCALSRYPILRWENQDVSAHRFESRGLLHCEIAVPGWPQPLHCVCVHLALNARGRSRQLEHLRQRVERMVPADAPLVVAGDFNDWHWRHRATHEFAHPLNMHEVFEFDGGRPARSFPALLPLLCLDRIYVRGFSVRQANVQHRRGWRLSSDHRALTCDLILT